MMAAPKIFVYWGSGSVPCWRVLLVLKEKGLSYQEKIVSFSKKEHKSDEIFALNPRGQVPTTKINDLVINESRAACDYLEMEYGSQGTRLFPQDPTQLALVLQRHHEAANIQQSMTDVWKYYLNKKEDTNYEDELAKKKQALLDELKRWEGYMESQGSGSYIAGKDFSMADVMVYPHLAFTVRMGLDVQAHFPHLSAYYNKVTERPSVRDTWPPHWKEGDGPGFLKGL